MLRPFDTSKVNPVKLGPWIIRAAALAVIVAGGARFVKQPTFWLDEAFVAVSLRSPSSSVIFAPLEYGQYFPRLYLAAIAAIRELFGYAIWSLRLLPFLCFVTATLLWARLLAKRSQCFVPLAVLSAVLLVGASFWLDQAIQLKQYTFDVMLALVPFLIGDELLSETLVYGKRRWILVGLAAGCCLSYTYPFPLGARVLGWYLYRGPREGWGVNLRSAIVLGAVVGLGLVCVWMTDHRFNVNDRAAYLAYWHDCILRSSFEQGVSGAARLIGKFLWGWHGRQPLVTAGMVPLQIIGAYSVIKRWKTPGEGVGDRWGSRSVGSLVLLGAVIAASAILSYPICGGRVVLFAQAHTQILALEGALFVLLIPNKRAVTQILLAVFLCVTFAYSARVYVRYVRSEPAENLAPLISKIDPEIANTIWVHPCCVAQVRSLPAPLPVERILLGKDSEGLRLDHRRTGAEISAPLPGEKAWIIWSHMSGEACREPLEKVRSLALSWQVIEEGPDAGLALAQF